MVLLLLGLAGGGAVVVEQAEASEEYVRGLRMGREGSTLPRWTEDRAQVELPAWVRGPARLGLGTLLLAVALVVGGLAPGPAAALALVLLPVPLAGLAYADPFAALHLVRKLALFVPASVLVAALLLRGRLSWRAVGLFALALVLRADWVYHPHYDFKDVGIHWRLARIVHKRGMGEAWSGIDEHQQELELGKASVAGRLRPLPYPPAFHTLAGLIPAATLDVMKALGVLAQGISVLLVVALGWRISARHSTA